MGPRRKSISLAKMGGGLSLARAGCNPQAKQILRTASQWPSSEKIFLPSGFLIV